jgi:3-hydroxyisobutyrate dehydrogenase-like beta-hydroxyacid dehydrogenase
MARRIADAGIPLALWARRAQSLEQFQNTSATIASSPTDVAAQSEIVCVCVVNDQDVENVVLGSGGVLEGMREGGVVVIHSTVHPNTCRHLADLARPRGVGVIDAPVSGGGIAAEAGTLLVMVGGERHDVDRVRPIFGTYGNPVLHLGAIGSGQMAKLLNNYIFTAQLSAAIESFEFAERLGIDRSAMSEVLASGSGGSRAAAVIAGSGFETSGLRRTAASLLKKDVGILTELSSSVGAAVPPHLSALAHSTLEALTADTT